MEVLYEASAYSALAYHFSEKISKPLFGTPLSSVYEQPCKNETIQGREVCKEGASVRRRRKYSEAFGEIDQLSF